MTPQLFPGLVFDGNGDSVTPGAPNIGHSSPVCEFLARIVVVPDLDAVIGRVWMVEQASRFDDIPAAERYAAHAIMRGGFSVMVMARDPDTAAVVATGLRELIDDDVTRQDWFGYA